MYTDIQEPMLNATQEQVMEHIHCHLLLIKFVNKMKQNELYNFPRWISSIIFLTIAVFFDKNQVGVNCNHPGASCSKHDCFCFCHLFKYKFSSVLEEIR